MKLKIFLFLALFFSSFSALADMYFTDVWKAQAKAYELGIPPYAAATSIPAGSPPCAAGSNWFVFYGSSQNLYYCSNGAYSPSYDCGGDGSLTGKETGQCLTPKPVNCVLSDSTNFNAPTCIVQPNQSCSLSTRDVGGVVSAFLVCNPSSSSTPDFDCSGVANMYKSSASCAFCPDGQNHNAAGTGCELPPKKCDFPLINDPTNNQNCIMPPAVKCDAPLLRDSNLTLSDGTTNPKFNTCVEPPPVVCDNKSTRDGSLTSPTYNKCVTNPRPDYCGSAFKWDGANCTLTDITQTKTTTAAPTPENPNPTPQPAQTAATTSTSSVTNSDGTITTTSVVTNADGSKTTTVYRAPAAGTSANTVGTGACNSGDSCNQADLKKNTADTAKNTADIKKNTADAVTALNKLDTDLTKQPSVTGSQYTKSQKTMQGAFSDFKTRMSNSSLISTASGFFTLNSAGGSCPVWSDNIMGISMVIDQQCGPVMVGTVFPMVRVALLFVASFMAFRIAFL